MKKEHKHKIFELESNNSNIFLFVICIAVFSVFIFSTNAYADNQHYYPDSIIFTDPYRPDLMPEEPHTSKHLMKRLRKKKNYEFYNAAIFGNLDKIKRSYEQGYENQTIESNGAYVLGMAAQQGHFNIVVYMLNEGVDINAKVENKRYSSKLGWTPLMFASFGGHEEMVRSFLQDGADVLAQSEYGFTALYLAALNNHLEIVRILLEYGADVNAQIYNGMAPLHVSSSKEFSYTTETLIRAGADVNIKDKQGNSALHYAVQKYNIYTIKILILSGADVLAKNNKGETPQDVVGDGFKYKLRNSRWPDTNQTSRRITNELLEHYAN